MIKERPTIVVAGESRSSVRLEKEKWQNHFERAIETIYHCTVLIFLEFRIVLQVVLIRIAATSEVDAASQDQNYHRCLYYQRHGGTQSVGEAAMSAV